MVEVSSLYAALTKAVAPSATTLLKKVGKDQYDRFIATYTNVFADHIRATEARCSSIKTILHRDDPVSLNSQYVNLSFEVGDRVVTDIEVINYAVELGNAFLVSGLAGSGKSMFMKWAALQLIERIPDTQRIPLFIEIREVAPEKLDLPFDQIVFEMSSTELSKATFDQFFVGLSEGQFIVMIDGLDEVPVKHRDAILNEISDFRRRFPSASLICSSRPDRQLESSNALRVYHVQDMSLEQICQVIQNALFSEDKKTAFIEALRDGLYEQHESFLSNPLLATIMLITYDVGSGVPNKLSIFYSQVYEALFYKHDSSKGVYVREHYSKLDIDQFENAFRTFCFQSYAMSKITFQSSELMDLIRASLQQARVGTEPSDFIKDCKKSLCLLQEDGLYTTFVHRSFQEYFSARFLAAYGGPEYKVLVDEIVVRGFSDNTLRMLCQIDPEDVLRRWCAAKVDELITELEELDSDNAIEFRDYLKGYAAAVYFHADLGGGLAFGWGYRDKIRFVQAVCDVLSACGIDARPSVHSGNIYRNKDRETAPPELFDLMEEEEETDEEGDRVYNEEDDEPVFTGRHYFQFQHVPPEILLSTGLPEYFDKLRSSLYAAKSAISERLQSSDDFARRVGQLFGAGRI